jgi:hypothetical protein
MNKDEIITELVNINDDLFLKGQEDLYNKLSKTIRNIERYL